MREPQIQPPPGFDAEAMQHAGAAMQHARAEVQLLAAVCPIGRRGLALVREAGIVPADFEQPDTAAIYLAIEAAELGGIIGNRERTYLLARRALILVDLWDEADERSFAEGGMVRGPGPLAVLFCRMASDTAVRMVPLLAAQLIGIRARRAA